MGNSNNIFFVKKNLQKSAFWHIKSEIGLLKKKLHLNVWIPGILFEKEERSHSVQS